MWKIESLISSCRTEKPQRIFFYHFCSKANDEISPHFHSIHMFCSPVFVVITWWFSTNFDVRMCIDLFMLWLVERMSDVTLIENGRFALIKTNFNCHCLFEMFYLFIFALFSLESKVKSKLYNQLNWRAISRHVNHFGL